MLTYEIAIDGNNPGDPERVERRAVTLPPEGMFNPAPFVNLAYVEMMEVAGPAAVPRHCPECSTIFGASSVRGHVAVDPVTQAVSIKRRRPAFFCMKCERKIHW